MIGLKIDISKRSLSGKRAYAISWACQCNGEYCQDQSFHRIESRMKAHHEDWLEVLFSMIQPLAHAGPQPADISRWRQNVCNLLLYLTTKHIFANFSWCNCPVVPLVVGLAAHLLCMEHRTMAVFLLRSQLVAQPEWGRRSRGLPEANLLRFLLVPWINFQLLARRQWLPLQSKLLAALQVAAIGSTMNLSCYYVMQGFITLSARANDSLAADIRTWAVSMMTIRDADPRVLPSVAEIVAAVQQMAVFFVWRMKPTCFCVLDIY